MENAWRERHDVVFLCFWFPESIGFPVNTREATVLCGPIPLPVSEREALSETVPLAPEVEWHRRAHTRTYLKYLAEMGKFSYYLVEKMTTMVLVCANRRECRGATEQASE